MATPASASHGLYQLLETGCEVPYERVKQLLVQGANPFSPFDTDESCALFLCVERNDESLVQLLLDRNWNQSGKKSSKRLFITNFEGLSALMLAARQGYSGCINLLLSAGFNSPELLNMRASGGSSHGSTALMLACVGQHINAAKSLLENGADPSISDSEGCSPMHIAAMQGNLDLIEALKEHGGLLQVVDKQGNTPMHFCVHANVLEYLYQEGVSPSTRNKRGSTPLDILQRMNADSTALAMLQQLAEDERRRLTLNRMGILAKFVYGLKWTAGDLIRELGWKLALLVVVLICIIAWQVTVYLHGQSPFLIHHTI